MEKHYEDIIHSIYLDFPKNETQQFQIAKITEIFENKKQTIEKLNNGLKIIMDNGLARSIMKSVKKMESQTILNFNEFKSMLDYLILFADLLLSLKYITRREKNRIDQISTKIKSSFQFKTHCRIPALSRSDDKEELREDLFDIFGIKIDGSEEEEEIKKLYGQFYTDAMKSMDRKLFVKIDSIISKFENRKEILGPLFQCVDDYLGLEIGKDDVEIEINKILAQTAESDSLESNQECLDLMEEQFTWLRLILNKFSGMRPFVEGFRMDLRLAKFGSIVSGFATKNTDMDLTILTNCYVNEIWLLQYFEAFIKAELKEKRRTDWEVKFIKNARIPLLQLKHTSRKGPVFIDLIVNNILGIINSKFLSVYASIKWIKHLGLLIKTWAKGKSQSLVKEELFSSYCFNILLLNFLIDTRKINLIMDARNRSDKTPHFVYKRIVKGEKEQFPVYFEFNTDPKEVTNINRANLYEILTSFFEYYSESGKHWNFSKEESVITLDGVKSKDFDENNIFTIKDPFDEFYNPGRVSVQSKDRTIRCFNSAFETMKSKNIEDIKALFDERAI